MKILRVTFRTAGCGVEYDIESCCEIVVSDEAADIIMGRNAKIEKDYECGPISYIQNVVDATAVLQTNGRRADGKIVDIQEVDI
ncbi:MAG: hypothetical protein LUD27_00725 [Clostridia bacterium]|nr:hypothetical protein [Clostridia bacterium]